MRHPEERQIIDRLVQIRVSRGLKQSDVAARMWVSRPMVAHLELGTHSPTLATLLRWADVLGAGIAVTS